MKTKYIEDLKSLQQATYNLNTEMESKLREIVTEYGGEQKLIRTDNQKICDENGEVIDWRTKLYGYVFKDGLNKTVEKKILAITIFENELAVLFEDEYDTLDELTDEEVVELDGWYYVIGWWVLTNATLYNICKTINEYI